MISSQHLVVFWFLVWSQVFKFRAFNRVDTNQAIAIDMLKYFRHFMFKCFMYFIFKYFKCSSVLGQVFGLISSFLSEEAFRWFYMVSLHKGITHMSVILKALLLVLRFFYVLMIFLIIVSVKLVSLLMIVLSTFYVWLVVWIVATARVIFWTWIRHTVERGINLVVNLKTGKTQFA